MLYDLLEMFSSPQGKRFTLKTHHYDILFPSPDPAGTEYIDTLNAPIDSNDGIYLIGFDFDAISTANAVLTSLDDFNNFQFVVRWNDVDLINKPGASSLFGNPFGIVPVQPYLREHSSITFGTAAQKSDFVSGRIPILAKLGPGGKVTIGLRRFQGAGTSTWRFTGVLYYSFYPYFQLPGAAIPGSMAE